MAEGNAPIPIQHRRVVRPVYQFIWSLEELEKFEEIFVKPWCGDEIPMFNTTLFYRQSKLTEKDREDGYPMTTFCKPCIYNPQYGLAKHFRREYERVIGAFDPVEYDGEAVPTRLYAVYFNNTPIDIKQAEKDAVQVMVNDIFAHGEVQGTMQSKLFSAFSKQKKHYVHLENDDKWWCDSASKLGPVDFAFKILGDNGVTPHILETLHGYHVLIHKDAFKQVHDLFPRVIRNIFLNGKGFTEVKSHGVIPIAGTLQFGFPVQFCYPSKTALQRLFDE